MATEEHTMKKTLTITIDYLEFALPADTTRADVAKIVALLAQMKKVESNYLGEHRAEGEPTSVYYAQDEYASIRLNDRTLHDKTVAYEMYQAAKARREASEA
jgi:hypothetical protein